MQYQITSDNIELTESMKAMAQEKFAKFETKLNDGDLESASARIVLNKSGAEDEFRVKAEVVVRGHKYFASERDFLLESAVIKAVAELMRMYNKDHDFEKDWETKRDLKRNQTEEIEEAL